MADVSAGEAMPANVTREEFGARMTVLEGEVEGEKLVTRYILEQTQQNGNDLAALKTRLDRIGGEIALARAALTAQTPMLNVLVQEVSGMRARLDGVDARLDGMDAKLDAVLTAVRALTPRDPPA
jgi:hypothetical protein